MGILAECPICHAKQSVKNKRCKCGEDLDKAKKRQTGNRVRYWIAYRMPDGTQRRESLATFEEADPYSITDAKDVLSKRQVQKREKRIFEILPESDKTFNELAEWYLGLEKIKSMAYYKALQVILGRFNDHFGDWLVGNVKPADLENYQVKQKDQGYSDAYVDQQVNAAKAMINKAFDNDLIGGDCLKPFRKIKKLLKKGANARKRALTHQEYGRLLDALPDHSKPIVATAFWTGMRLDEILTLQWEKIDLSNRIIRLKAEDTKEGRPKNIPISKTLRSVLMQIPERGRDGLVFTYGGKPVKDIRQGLQNACESIGIAYGRFAENGFVFHDVRHTWATNARRAGVSRNVRMAIMGHSGGNDMNYRYDTIDESDLIDAIDKIEAFLKNVDQNVDQTVNCLPK